MKVADIVFFVIALIVIIIALIFAYRASHNMSKNPNLSSDTTATKAKSYMNWTLWVGIVGILLLFGSGIMLFIYGDKSKTGKNIIVIGMLVLTVVVTFIAGILSILGARDWNKSQSNTKTGSDSTAYNSAIISAVLLIGIMTLVLVAWALAYMIRKPSRAAILASPLAFIPSSVALGVTPSSDTKPLVKTTK